MCAQSWLSLCDSVPMVCSPPGSSVHGIFQARKLEWVAISFSRRSANPGIHWQSDSFTTEQPGKPHWYICLSDHNSLFHWHIKFLLCTNESVDQGIGMSKGMCKLLWRKEVSSLNQDKLHRICTVLWKEQGLCS